MIFQFQPGNSWFHRLDPGSKFVWLASISVLSLAIEQALFQGMLLLAVLLFGRIAARMPPGTIWKGLRLPIWFGIPYFLLQLLFVPGTTILLAIGPLEVTAEALQFSAAISLRLLTLVFASFVMIVTTDPRDAVLALAQQLRVPYKFAFAVSIALRFLPILEAEAASVRAAQRLRGFTSGSGRTLRMKLSEHRRFAFTVFANSVRRVQSIAETMESRGFGKHPTRTYRRRLNIPPSGLVLSSFSIMSAAALLLWYSF